VRHPFYLSYVVAFLGVVAAFPSLATGCVCLLNIIFFLYTAFDDERVLLLSPLAADYRAYRMRAGMFLPRVRFSISLVTTALQYPGIGRKQCEADTSQ
jgi:protein-S-isoprenylcysteine O-methyltransferase Ste14